MTIAAAIRWTDANQAFLAAEFERLKRRLEPGPIAGGAGDTAAQLPPMADLPAIDQLSAVFGLSVFERDILLLAAGVEMDSELASRCRQMQSSGPRAGVTFALALAVLREPHWSALTMARPLRRYRLIEMDTGYGLTNAALRIDERILHYLAGVNLPDVRLQPYLQPDDVPDSIPTEHRAVSEESLRLLSSDTQPVPALHYCGNDPLGQEDTAALTAAGLERRRFLIKSEDLPPVGPELDLLQMLLEREAALLPAGLFIQCGAAPLSSSARQLGEKAPGIVILASREPIHLDRALVRFEVGKPRPLAQRRMWEEAFGERAAGRHETIDMVSAHFRLSARTILSARALMDSAENGAADLWRICRSQSRPRLENLAQRLTAELTWDDLVLPPRQIEALRHLALQVRHRMKVHEDWGFSAKSSRGLGLSALFSGESGTGKTMAAEVLARELDLDLYRIDLSAVVSKYIGETEKNLKQVFDAAEEGGALLLFDEADALFGKRSDVKDSRDRYANIEVGYLLQRMEAYQGLAVLTTNLKSSMDRAFQRRLRVTINFPFPDASQREAIWCRVFPAGVPLRGVDPKKLAQLNVAGGSIRNIALNAAFLAAASGGPVEMSHLLRAATLEGEKIERPLSEAEVRGWV